MKKRPIVLVHGYSAAGAGFQRWAEILQDFGYKASDIHICNYQSLTNEVTIKDIAEGFNRALHEQVELNRNEEFDAIVHSTGMLVIRAWLTAYSRRRNRLKHLIGLAPANFGSPLAHKGRSLLGAFFKGNTKLGPDFLEAGDLILDGLELASRFTWDLSHQDMLGEKTYYDLTPNTPYVFTFCGTEGFGEPFKLVSQPGTDGTVRLAGCSLNTRKITLDLSRELEPDSEGTHLTSQGRVGTVKNYNLESKFVPIEGLHHGTILSNPSDILKGFVREALEISNRTSYEAWCDRARVYREELLQKRSDLGSWQQFIIRIVDERGDSIPDFYIDFVTKRRGGSTWHPIQEVHPNFEMTLHPYSADKSFRCVHIDLKTVPVADGDVLGIRLIASSGSRLVGYNGFIDGEVQTKLNEQNPQGEWCGILDISTLPEIKFFYPFTTTLIEIKFDREPLPLRGVTELLFFQVESVPTNTSTA